MRALGVVALVAAVSACGPTLVVLDQPAAVVGLEPSSAPGFVILPAVDQRPLEEIEGDRPEHTLRMLASGAVLLWTAGAEVRPDREGIAWERNQFAELPAAAETTVASDLAAAMEASFGRPVALWPLFAKTRDEVEALVRRAKVPDGTVLVVPIIDHLAEITPTTEQASATRTETSTHVTTTTTYASQAVSTTWNVMVRLHVFELRGGGVARHVVRYAAAAGHRDAYAKALQQAVREVHFVTVNYYRP